MASIHEEAVVAERDHRPLLSWGAVFAGLAFVVAATWLLFLLGSAIGVSIADTTDAQAMGKGLGIGATVWLLLTSLLVFFLGSLLTARLSGKHEHAVGMLHGVTLWSVGTALMLILGAWGVKGLIQTGASAISAVASVAASAGSAGAEGAQQGGGIDELADSELMNTVEARLKREISAAVAEAQRSGAQDDPAASQREVRRALDQIDKDTLVAMARPIIAGEPERAKDVLAANTNLNEREIDAVVDSVSDEMSQQIDEAKQQMGEAVEVASTYAQAVSWAAFIAGALGLVVSIAGGWLGAGTVRRLYTVDATRRTAVQSEDRV
ncbi:hypothetical protein BH24PSE2_BH24PSE2_11100 [soil metagenome]